MGAKPSNNFQSDRPESGGANHDSERENSGLLDREKERFAEEQVEKRADAPEQRNPNHEPFSVGTPPNPTKKH